MKVKRSTMLAASLLVMLAASGCQREATGQVVAVVNGEEITLQELNAEIGDAQLPKNMDAKEIQKRLLQRIVDRRLIAMAARKDGIDKDQEYLLRQRQTDDALLRDLLGQRTERTFRIPDEAAIKKYMAAHPTIFANREIFQMDRLQFAMPSDANVVRKLESDHTMEAVAAKLTSLGITFSRGLAEVDSATLPPLMVERIKSLPPGEPFLVPQPGGISAAVITSTRPAPLAPGQARSVAVQLMRKEAVESALEQRLKTEKASAKIEYQPGFAPAKPGKS